MIKSLFDKILQKSMSSPSSLTNTGGPSSLAPTQKKLPPEVNRILFVRNLPFKVTAGELYELFGKYGPIYQVRLGTSPSTKGTAYVIYEDIYDAKSACESLSGFNLMGRYLIVLYYQVHKMNKKADLRRKEREVEALKAKLMAENQSGGVDGQS